MSGSQARFTEELPEDELPEHKRLFWPLAALIGTFVGAFGSAVPVLMASCLDGALLAIGVAAMLGALGGTAAGAMSASDGIGGVCRNAFLIGVFGGIVALVFVLILLCFSSAGT